MPEVTGLALCQRCVQHCLPFDEGRSGEERQREDEERLKTFGHVVSVTARFSILSEIIKIEQ